MAADKSDEPGVLGNLPSSRPGHRSDKRGAGSRGAGAAATNRRRAAAFAPKPAAAPRQATRAKAARGKPSARAKPAARGSKAAAGSAGTATREPRPQVESPEAARTARPIRSPEP